MRIYGILSDGIFDSDDYSLVHPPLHMLSFAIYKLPRPNVSMDIVLKSPLLHYKPMMDVIGTTYKLSNNDVEAAALFSGMIHLNRYEPLNSDVLVYLFSDSTQVVHSLCRIIDGIDQAPANNGEPPRIPLRKQLDHMEQLFHKLKRFTKFRFREQVIPRWIPGRRMKATVINH